ncbi:hypothetical protein [Azospirillum himalayense]|uniref:Transposase n=1 Tax=Azospirillum himalayense TaxID=654847 RepID=A0ABW0GGH4_9PROT
MEKPPRHRLSDAEKDALLMEQAALIEQLKRIVAEYRRNFGWPARLEEDTAEGGRSMGQPYSADLRERVLLAYERREGGPELLSLAVLCRTLKRLGLARKKRR